MQQYNTALLSEQGRMLHNNSKGRNSGNDTKKGGGGLHVHLPKSRVSDRDLKPFTGKDGGGENG